MLNNNNKPPICEWFRTFYTTYKNGDDWGMGSWHCFTHIGLYQIIDNITLPTCINYIYVYIYIFIPNDC